MSLSACSHCWDDPCTCGRGYLDKKYSDLCDFIAMLDALRRAHLIVRNGRNPPVSKDALRAAVWAEFERIRAKESTR